MPLLKSPSNVTRASVLGATSLIALLLAGICGWMEAGATSKLTREYDLKAAFLFNFAQFVEWPPEAFPEHDTPITIGVLGEDPFGTSLDEIVANEEVRNRKLVVRRYHDVSEVGNCHILFISQSQSSQIEKVRAYLDNKSILSVGETPDFATHTGIIQFVIVDNRLRLRISVEKAKAARLSISSKLLRQAEITAPDSRR